MKKVFLFLVALVLLLGGAAYYLMGNLDQIVKQQVESHGTELLKTSVKLNEVEIRLLDGFGELRGFSIANPNGFSERTLMGFDTIRLDIKTEDISQKPLVIEEILIDSVAALYEVNDKAKGNMNVLLDNAKSTGGDASSGSSSSDNAESGSTESDVRIAVKQIVVKDTQLKLDLTKIGLKAYDETLPTFTASNIGGTSGLPPKELGVEIAKVMLDNLTKQARKKQEDKLKDKAKAKIMEKIEEKGGEKVKGFLNKLGGSL